MSSSSLACFTYLALTKLTLSTPFGHKSSIVSLSNFKWPYCTLQLHQSENDPDVVGSLLTAPCWNVFAIPTRLSLYSANRSETNYLFSSHIAVELGWLFCLALFRVQHAPTIRNHQHHDRETAQQTTEIGWFTFAQCAVIYRLRVKRTFRVGIGSSHEPRYGGTPLHAFSAQYFDQTTPFSSAALHYYNLGWGRENLQSYLQWFSTSRATGQPTDCTVG